MKVLAISDRVVKRIYDEKIKQRFSDIELVLACGDLPFYYLEYVVTMLNVPVYYVLGNHCPPVRGDYPGTKLKQPPGGAVNLDGRVVNHDGLILAGLEGSIRYNRRPYHQYTESEMRLKVLRLIPRLLIQRLRHGRYLDILITHSPPLDIHDGSDHAHRGFAVFRWFMKTFQPRHLIHGHKHVYSSREATETRYHDTWVINAFGHKVLDIEAVQSARTQEPLLSTKGNSDITKLTRAGQHSEGERSCAS